MNWLDESETEQFDYSDEDPDLVDVSFFEADLDFDSESEPICIDLKSLLSPHAHEIMLGEQINESDKQTALYDLAVEATGWQRWMQTQEIELEGNPVVLTQQTARKLGINVSTANQILETVKSEDCMPAAWHQGGDTGCWQKITQIEPNLLEYADSTNLKPDNTQQIPPNRPIKPEGAQSGASATTESRTRPAAQYSSFNPEGAKTVLNPALETEPPEPQSGFNQASSRPIPKPRAEASEDGQLPSIAVEFKQEQQQSDQSNPKQRLDRDLADLGRQIVQIAGEEKDNKLEFTGKVQYKIIVNLDTNAMQIYSKDRGDDPILVDANGRIDHEASRATKEDVEKFSAALKFLQQDHEKKVVNYER